MSPEQIERFFVHSIRDYSFQQLRDLKKLGLIQLGG